MSERWVKQILPVLVPVLIFGGVGVAVILMGSGVIPLDPESQHAPRWVLLFCGIPFLSVGLLVISQHFNAFSWYRDFAGLIIFTSFAVIMDWIAFGPGDREFDSNISGAAANIAGRIAFGLGGVFFSAIAVSGWLRAFRARKFNKPVHGIDASASNHEK